jgi:hypothetical protein
MTYLWPEAIFVIMVLAGVVFSRTVRRRLVRAAARAWLRLETPARAV